MDSIFGIKVKKIDGTETTLGALKAKAVLVVNVASKCGLTPQYEGLEKLYGHYRERGLSVAGFPANEFAAQEPGSNLEIQEFCRANFGVQFPLFEKIVVKGPGIHPLYQALTQAQPASQKDPASGFEAKLQQHGLLTGVPSEIRWNFEKFLVNGKGLVVARFAPDIEPNDPMIIKAIEQELAR